MENKNYLKIAGNIHLSYYIEAAEFLGIEYEIIVKGLVAKITHKGNHCYIINTVVPLNPVPSCTIAKRKYLTSLVLDKAGIPVPQQCKPTTKEDAITIFKQLKTIVIKPAQGLGGHGVTVLPRTEEEVEKAYAAAVAYNKSKERVKVLVEEFINGENYRILVLNDQVIGVVHRTPAKVIGDGLMTIKQLIETTNKERSTRLLLPIPIDSETVKKLDIQKMTLESVPKSGQKVYLRFNANLTTGGSTEECADKMHQHYKDIAIRATKEIGLSFAGVDLIAEDITDPTKKCAINEVNYNPGLRPHYKPDSGEIVKVAIPIMEAIRTSLENQK